MAKLRYLVVGSGWRSLFYVRIAQALPQQFELCAVLCRSEEKADQLRRYGAPASTSAEACAALRPDFVVVAVNKAALAQVSREWLDRGFAVLCETPAALEEEQLRGLWQLHSAGARLQIAEQYWLYPALAARLEAVRQGLVGRPAFARLSLAHGYHAASLARLALETGMQPVTVEGRAWPVEIVETDSRWGPVHRGPLVQKTLQRHTLQFADGAAAFVDFCNVQYHSYLRTTHLNIQGPRGELDDDTLRWLDDREEPRLDRIQCREGVYTLGERVLYRTPFYGSGLGQDETAIASFLAGMEGYLTSGEPVYPLADALQDGYLGILMERSLHTDGPVQSQPQPWGDRCGSGANLSKKSVPLD